MELLIYVPKITPRINYTFRQVCKRILGFNINFTTKIETFISYDGPKFSYTTQRLGNEVFIQSYGILEEQGINDMEILMSEWKGEPYFFKTSKQSDIPFDIFSASFYLLSRYEEYLPHLKNHLGDFPAEESIAYKNNFLDKPVINIWMSRFLEILKAKFKDIQTPQKTPTIKLVIAVEKAFQYRELGILRGFVGLMKDALRFRFRDVFTRIQSWFIPEKDPYDVYDFLIKTKNELGIEMLFLFQLGDYSIYTKNINFRKKEYKRIIKSMGDYSEIGLLLSHEAIFDVLTLNKEIKRFENIANHELKSVVIKGRSINFPGYFVNLDETTIKDDYSMGYYNKIGFRTGTYTPHLFYDLNLEQASPIEIHPYYASSPNFCQTGEKVLRQKLSYLKNYPVNCNILVSNSDFKLSSQKETILKKISIIKECLQEK